MRVFLPDQWTLDALARELNDRWAGRRIHGVERRGDRVVSLRIRGGDGQRPELLATAWPGRALLHPSESPIDLPLLPREPDRALAPFLKGAKIRNVLSIPGARTLDFELEARSIGEAAMRFKVAGHRADVFLRAGDQRIAGLPERPTRSQRPQERSPANLFEALGRERPGACPNAIREAAFRRGHPVDGAPDAATECIDELDRLLEMAAQSDAGFAYRRDGALVAWSPVPLEHLGESCTVADAPEVGAELDSTYRETLPTFLVGSTRERLLRDTDRDIRKAAKRLRKVEEDVARCLDAERFQRSGGALLAPLHATRKGMSDAAILDPYDADGATVVVELDPALEPQANADLYFRKARKARDGKIKTQERLERTRAEIAALEAERTRLGEATDASELFRDGAERPPQRTTRRSPTAGAGTKRKGRKGRLTEDDLPLRRYELPGGWKVLAARNARDNDVLTVKIAHLADLWFHARGTTGSHVVLRCAGRKAQPDRRTIEAVAAIAAWHSKARHSKLVPVAYTERRHVRKVRGAPTGMVSLSRESVVFVEPALPEGYKH